MHNPPGEPAGDSTDQKKDDETRERHFMPPDGATFGSVSRHFPDSRTVSVIVRCFGRRDNTLQPR
jgi:hypothetical protein